MTCVLEVAARMLSDYSAPLRKKGTMKAQIKLGRIFGVEIGLHYSWFLIALLITLSLAEQFRVNNPDWGVNLRWALAVFTAVLFFAAIIAHELSHALVAKARGLPVRSITLFALGGVAQIEKEPADAKTEFWMGIIGPITSLVIGAICLAITLALGWTPPEFPKSTTAGDVDVAWLHQYWPWHLQLDPRFSA